MQNLSITRIMIAHRQKTIARANTVLRIEQGKLFNITDDMAKQSA